MGVWLPLPGACAAVRPKSISKTHSGNFTLGALQAFWWHEGRPPSSSPIKPGRKLGTLPRGGFSTQGIAEGAMADESSDHEAEKIQGLSKEPFEVLEYLRKKSEQAAVDVVRNELIEQKKLPGPSSPELSEFAKSRLHNLGSRNARYRKAIELKRAREGTFGRTPATGMAVGDNTGAGSEQPAALPDGSKRTGTRERIDAFISKLNEAGSKISRKDMWTVAGYTDRTEFERFQRDAPRSTRSGRANFNRVLQMTPRDFMAALKKKASK